MRKKVPAIILLSMLMFSLAGCSLISEKGTEEIKDENGYILHELDSSDLKDLQITNGAVIEIPATFEKNEKKYKVIGIDDYTFKNYHLAETIILPDTILSIGSYAFTGCANLTKIIIPESVTKIDGYAFHMCVNLKELYLPKNINELGRNIAAGCSSLIDIMVDENNSNYTSKDGVVFTKDETTLVCLPSGRTEYIIPETTTTIADSAFSNSNLQSIIIPENIIEIKDNAFIACRSLTKVVLPSSITKISNYMFYSCSALSDITLPDTITTIGNDAFFHCSSLTDFKIPNTVEKIGKTAFKGIDNIIYNGELKGAPWGANNLNKAD